MLLFCVHLCRRFAASPCAAEAKEHCSHSAYVPHNGAHRTITSRGAEHRSRKTKPLPCRQRTPVAIHAPARSFRGYGGIETPMLLVLLVPKEHQPSFGTKRTPSLDAHRHRFKGIRLLHAPPLIAQWHNKKTPPFCGFAMRILVLCLAKERAFAPKYFPFRHSVVKHQQTAKSFFKQKNEKFF